MNPHPTKLLIIGDSITLGVAELRGTMIAGYVRPCYVDLLRDDLAHMSIVIDADVHRTTNAVRDSVDQLVSQHAPDIALIMLGGNDADMDWRRFVLSDGKIARSRVDLAKYEQNLRQIGQKLLSLGVRPVLTDMPNHYFTIRGPYVSMLAGRDVTAMLERGGGQAESDRHLRTFRSAAALVAEELNVNLVRYGERLSALPAEEVVGIDGVHPSGNAHRIIADCLRPVLEAAARNVSVARPISA